MDDGSAGGPSQWSGHMLAVLANDTVCLRGLMCMVNDIINGHLSPQARSFITASRLTPIYKDAQTDRVRPIAIGEVLLRLASRILTNHVIPLAQPLLARQYGIGKQDGTAQVVHQLQTCLTDTEMPLAAITLDLRNAFNECSRRHMMEAIYARDELSLIWRYVDFSYSQPSDLWVEGADGNLKASRTLRSMQGVRQGDPLSPLLFALALQPVVKATYDDFHDRNANLVSYQDDTTIVAPVDIIFSVYDSFVQRAAQIGLHVQPAKCGFMYLHSENVPPHPSVAARIDSNVIPRSDVLTILGAPLGRISSTGDDVIIRDRLSRLQLVTKRLLDKRISKQIAFLLLRKCAQFQLDYLLRMIEPALIESTARRCDEIILETASGIMGINLTDSSSLDGWQLAIARHQLWSPVSCGGLGMRSAEANRHVAFFAAHIGAIRDDPYAWDRIDGWHPNANSILMEVLKDCVSKIRSDIIDCIPTDASPESQSFREHQTEKLKAVLPPSQDLDFDSLMKFYVRNGPEQRANVDRLQTVLTQLANKSKNSAFVHRDSALINALPFAPLQETYRAHLANITSDEAKRWLNVIPRHHMQRMGNSELVYSMCFRLCMSCPNPTADKECPCTRTDSDQVGPYAHDPLHGVTCRRAAAQIIMRHNNINTMALATAMRKSGMVPEMEPAGYYSRDNRRPDVYVNANGRGMFTDTGVVHPSAPSNRNKKPRAAAEAYANAKVNKYRQLAMDNDAVIIPFIVETGGGYTDQAKHVIDDIVAHAQEHALAYSPASIRNEAMDTVAIQIQRGNANAMRRAREHSSIDRIRRSRPSTAQRRRFRARLLPIVESSRQRPSAIVSRQVVDVDVDPTIDEECERFMDSLFEQSVTPPASPIEDREANSKDQDGDDGDVNASQVVDYIDFTNSSATSVIECSA